METLLVILIIVIAFAAMTIYIMLKETTIFGKKYNDSYETDVTRKLGYKVWTFMWIFTCLLSIVLNYTLNSWKGSDDLILMFGSTCLFVILLLGWNFLKKRSCNADYYSHMKHVPGDLFNLLGVEIVEKRENGDYVVAYQGGYFLFSFVQDSEWVDIHFLNFDSCKYEYLHQAQMIVNNVNLRYWGWSCYLQMSGDEAAEEPLQASLSYRYALAGTLPQIKILLKEVLEQAFHIAHYFRNTLAEDIKKKKDLDEQFFNDATFNNRIAYLQRMKETHHLEERGEEFPESSELSVDNLIKLFDHIDFGSLQNLKIVRDEQVECMTDVEEIKSFNLREYIRKQPEVLNIRSLTLIFGFEHQDLFVNLAKAKGSTERSLFFVVNVLRSGSELDALMDNRERIGSRTMMEIRLTDADKDYWEAKYMIDEAHDKVNAGKSDELTEEQRIILSHTDPTVQMDLYWGKKYFNNRCYFQSLYYFNRVYGYLRHMKQEWDEEQSKLYHEMCYYIGFIYVDLNMYDKAFYYLYMAQSQHSIGATKEFANCLCNMNDPSAKQYLHSKINEVVEIMNKSEEAERLMDFYLFLKRRYVYVLIEYGNYDDAENILKQMIEREECLDFVKDELEYIKKQRGEKEPEYNEEPKNKYL